jgi:folate-dependent phosphoribosylglycinamide formyltransferase PurN
MGGKHKSLHEFMIDEKIPRHVREFVPILADDTVEMLETRVHEVEHRLLVDTLKKLENGD